MMSYNTRKVDNLKISTWNLCLGLINKKEIVTDYLQSKNVQVCCLQETEIPMNFPENDFFFVVVVVIV